MTRSAPTGSFRADHDRVALRGGQVEIHWLAVGVNRRVQHAETSARRDIVDEPGEDVLVADARTLGRAQVQRELVNEYESAAEPAGPRALPGDQDGTGRHREDSQPNVVLGLLPEDGGVLGVELDAARVTECFDEIRQGLERGNPLGK